MMEFTVYTKQNCPFCVKAKQALTSAGYAYKEVGITTPEELPRPDFRTVPQILADGHFVGGYTQLVSYLEGLNKPKKTVFNTKNTGHLTGQYPLFLGEDLGFADSINQPYPQLEALYDKQMSFIWNHTEVDLTQDRQDMITAPAATTELMVENILWQSMADSIASRAIGSVLTKYVSNQALQDWYNAVILFETIHAKTYLHIIKQCFTDPNEVLKRGYRNLEIVKRSNILIDSFDELAGADPDTLPKEKMQELVLFCVIAMYLLERVNFMASFAITFAIGERSIYQGITQDVTLICRDEMLHAKGGEVVLRLLRNQWPDTYKALLPKIEAVFYALRQGEHDWTDHAFSNGRSVVGTNANRIKAYVDYNLIEVANVLGITSYTTEYVENPLPYMDNYTDSSNVQAAAQEIQLTNYLVNSVKLESEESIANVLANLREVYSE